MPIKICASSQRVQQLGLPGRQTFLTLVGRPSCTAVQGTKIVPDLYNRRRSACEEAPCATHLPFAQDCPIQANGIACHYKHVSTKSCTTFLKKFVQVPGCQSAPKEAWLMFQRHKVASPDHCTMLPKTLLHVAEMSICRFSPGMYWQSNADW